MKKLLLLPLATLLLFAPSSGRAQTTSGLEITAGSWGYAGDRKNVKDDLAKLCNGKPSCRFLVKNETFTLAEPVDPSPGNPKGLILRWKCGEAELRDQFPQNKYAELKCPAGP